MVLGQTELLVILLILLLLFGSSKLPELARSMGRAKKEFKEGMDDEKAGEAGAPSAPATPEAAQPVQPAQPEPKAEAPAEEEKKPAATK